MVIPIEFCFYDFVYISNADWQFYVFKINYFCKIFIRFLISPGLRSSGSTCLIKHHLNHLLSSVFWILIKRFLGWSNSFGNLMQLLPAKGLYFCNNNIMIYGWINNPAWTLPWRFLYVWYNSILDWFKYMINVAFLNSCFCFWVQIKGAKIFFHCFVSF